MKTIICILMGLLYLNIGYIQTQTITGTVSDAESGEPIPGVNVVVKGTTTGTITDYEGNYTIEVPQNGVLVFSFVGFVTQEVEVKDQTTINISLEMELAELEELVVVGYGVKKRSDMTGAVSSFSLSGRASGVAIYGSKGIRGSRSRRTSDRVLPGKTTGSEALYTTPEVSAGILTAGELHDFSKWDLWTDIAEGVLQGFQSVWNIQPLQRVMVQMTFENGVPVIDCPVELVNATNRVLWQARTDNTGKAELWLDLFNEQDDELANCTIRARCKGQTYTIDKPKEFKKGQNHIMVPYSCEVPDLLEAMFVVDATSSMNDEIHYLKEELKYVINKVKENHADLTISLGSVFYRDVGDEYVTRKSDLSTDITQTYNFINSEYGGGGGDYPEAVEQALDVAINEITWSKEARARLLFLVLDAPPHQTPDILKKLQRVTTEAAAKGIKIIPVASSGIDKSTEYLLRSLALTTNGTYLFLTDHSGVGGSHIKPSTDKYDVNLLNNLLLKVFYQYTYTPPCDYQEIGFYKKDSIELDVIATVVIDSIALEIELDVKVDTTQSAKVDTIPDQDEQTGDYEEDFTTHYINQEVKEKMKVFPNPTDGLLNIEIQKGITEVFMADISGKLLERFEVKEDNTNQINIGQYPTGIYFIRYEKEGKWYGEKVLLVH